MSIIDTGSPEERERRWREWLASGGIGPPPVDDRQGGLLGLPNGRLPSGGLLDPGDDEPARRKGFWQGGEKFGVKDGIAGLLATLADGLAIQGGGVPQTGEMLTGGRSDALERLERQQEEQKKIERIRETAAKLGYSPDQIEGLLVGVKPPEDKTPSWLKESEIYATLPEDQRAKVNKYLDAFKPMMNNGPYGSEIIPRDALGTGGPPSAAIEMLRANPSLADQFDQKYGAGASQRYLGGGGIGNGPGRFR